MKEIPGLGPVTKDEQIDTWWRSTPISIPALDGKVLQIVVEDYENDPGKNDFHQAIENFLSIDRSALTEATEHVYRYYEDMNGDWEPKDEEFVAIKEPHEVWNHVQIGDTAVVSRRAYGDKEIYVSIECRCDWEPEHGLQLVFKKGLKISKIGPFDGHLTNSDAYDDESLEEIVYKET